MGATVYPICTWKFPFMEFNAPHLDLKSRLAMAQEIKTNLATLVEVFSNNVSDDLTRQLNTLLKPCFKAEKDRATAEVVSQSFF